VNLPEIVTALAGRVFCPDDGARLHTLAAGFACGECGRSFPVHASGLVELLPSNARVLDGEVSSSYMKEYLSEFHRRFIWDESALAWGAPEISTRAWVEKRHRQVQFMLTLLRDRAERRNCMVCDISAGPGYYTFACAPYFDRVVHCDLAVNSLNYAMRKAKKNGITNVIFLRTDYFSPPFRKSMDLLLCFDTLIRGEAHEVGLLEAIVRSLASRGEAIVDFHNWWHNPLRRLGLLPENFRENRSYRRSEADQLLHSIGIQKFCVRQFVQEFDPGAASAGFLSKIFPSTRLIYRFAPAPTRASHTVVARAAGARQ
jgi:SAM-dependent methyltransferase